MVTVKICVKIGGGDRLQGMNAIMNMKPRTAVVSIFVFATLPGISASAQADDGELAVVVKDEQGKAITTSQGAAKLGDIGKATTHRGISLGVGTPVFIVAEGSYWLEVLAPCYETRRINQITVKGNTTSYVTVVMKYTCDDEPST